MIDTHNLIVDFGKHKGERWTRLPVSYLRWLANQPLDPAMGDKNKKIAQAELERRGTTVPTELEISGHAIDSASLRVRKIWHETRNQDEGLHSWLYRLGSLALKEANGEEAIVYLGIKWVFVYGDFYPTLKTVMPK